MAKRRNPPPSAVAKPKSSAPSATAAAPLAVPPPLAPSVEPYARASLSWLTVERALWGVLILIAGAVRLLDLTHFPLDESEAALSTATLAMLSGQPEAALNASPFAVTLQTLLFTIFGANDATARMGAALAGIALVVLTYQLRGALSRWSALSAAALFALSPTFLYYSRTANGELIAVVAAYAALIAMWHVLQRPTPRWLYQLAIGAAIALTAGEAAYTIVLIAASFAFILWLSPRGRELLVPDAPAALTALRRDGTAARHALIVFVVAALASATTALLNPLGLQAALNLPAAWLSRWALAANQPLTYYWELFFAYELLPLVFGMTGLLYYLLRGDRLAPFLAWWLALALLWYTFAPFKSAGALLVMLVPLTLMAGRVASALVAALARDFSLANEGLFLILGLLTCGIFGLNLTNFAQTNQQNFLIVALIALAMLLMIGVLVTLWAALYRAPVAPASDDSNHHERAASPWQTGLARALPLLGTVVLVGLGVLYVHSALHLNFNEADDPRELMVSAPTTMAARDLEPMLAALSNRWEGDPRTVSIGADENVGAVLRWYLRDFRNVRYFTQPPLTTSEPIVIVAADAQPQPGFLDYVAQRMRWRWRKPAQPLEGPSLLRWLLFRGLHEVPPSYDIIIYAQKR